ncbi:MAG: pentapeptide repeat-containing protein [Candidatus Acidiferrales bacterium]
MFQRLFPTVEEEERPKAVLEALEGVMAETPAIARCETDTSPEPASAMATEVVETSATAASHRAESPDGLIDASQLPPAADVLAELFADAPAAEAGAAEKAGISTHASRVPDDDAAVAAEVAPKKQGFLARLFRSKRVPKETVSEIKAIEAPRPLESPSEAQAAIPGEPLGAIAPENEAEPEALAATQISSDPFVLAEIPIIPTTTGAGAEAWPPARQETIPAEQLLPAAEELEKPFSEDGTGVDVRKGSFLEEETIAGAGASDSADIEVEGPVELEDFDEPADEAPVEVVTIAATNLAADVLSDAQVGEAVPVSFASAIDENDSRFAFEAYGQIESREGETARSIERETGATRASAPFAATRARDEENVGASQAHDSEGHTVNAETEPAGTGKPVPFMETQRLYKDWAFDEKLASHAEWVESHGRTGQRADLSGAELEASDLISVNLRLADMHDTNLRASDLLLADLRDACLVRADLEEACLVGANLEGANLEGASLETAMGLVPRQFAGANLRDALLAPHLMEFDAVTAFGRESRNAFRYFWMMTAASVASWLLIAKTRDAQLLTDSAIIPFLHSHAAAAALPTAESYLVVPAGIFLLYVLFHFHLQRLWDSVGELPAIFPDGHTLGDSGPGIISGLLRTHFRWMNPDPPSTRLVEKSSSLAAAYWIVPVTLLLYWTRYLTRQEIHGTILLALLTTVAAGMATYGTLKVGRPQERWALENTWANRAVARVRAIHPISGAATLGVVLLLLSAGVIFGVPHDRARAPQYGLTNIRRWVPDAFWWLAYDPYADLTEASISRRPAGWNGSDEQIGSVDGLRANNAKFRYAQAYGAFLANSHLFQADLQGAFLSEADLRGADLGQSNMRYATMDHAQMNRANLDRSNLDGADLRRADLRGANLSYTSLENAVLVDARMDQASLYTARALGATLTRAVLEKADLREAYFVGAHMDHADLRSAYLWSARLSGADLGGAELESAILIDADLQGANLGGARLAGTVLNGAVFTGTSLEGADLRGALGLSASQICSARSRRGVMLDPDLETQVDALCGKP